MGMGIPGNAESQLGPLVLRASVHSVVNKIQVQQGAEAKKTKLWGALRNWGTCNHPLRLRLQLEDTERTERNAESLPGIGRQNCG